MESTHCRKIRRKESSGSNAPTPRQAGNTRATCRGTDDKATACPAAHKRITGKKMFDVFGGSGFLTKATNHVAFRDYVRDTELGPRYDVTKPLVLT